MRGFFVRAASQGLRGFSALAFYFACGFLYLASLLFIHSTIAVLSLSASRKPARARYAERDDAIPVGIVTGLVWACVCATMFGLLAESASAFFVVLSISFIPAAVAGWQIGRWRAASFWSRRPTSLTLGHRRDPIFLTDTPYVVPGPESVSEKPS